MFDVGDGVVEGLFGEVACLGGVVENLWLAHSRLVPRSRRRRSWVPSPVGRGWWSWGPARRCRWPSCRPSRPWDWPRRTAPPRRTPRCTARSRPASSGRRPCSLRCCRSAGCCARSASGCRRKICPARPRSSSCTPLTASGSCSPSTPPSARSRSRRARQSWAQITYLREPTVFL